MNTDEIVRELLPPKKCFDCRANFYARCAMLRKKISDYGVRKDCPLVKNADTIKSLTAQLAASQARERAAAEEKGELLRERLLLKRCVGALSLLIKGLEGRAVMQVVLPGAKKALSAYRGEYPAVNVVLDGGGPQAGEGQDG